MTDPARRKARGAFFTPPELAQYLAAWAIRTPGDRVLEPSCGEASFLLAAGQRLRTLGAGDSGDQLTGCEIHVASAAAAGRMLADHGLAARITAGDFFERPAEPAFDAVIGNPPYVRYQDFAGAARARAQRAALAGGVRLTGLASSWAAFTVHASRFLRPGGRLALVLPGELLSVNYAAEVRRFLLRRFARLRLVLFERRVFPGVAEEVVLLLAEGEGGAPSFEVVQAAGVGALAAPEAQAWIAHHPAEGQKWTPALIAADAFGLYRRVATGAHFAPLLDWGETTLGAVTGNNRFFALSRAEAGRQGLAERDLKAISPPGSRHLRTLAFGREDWGRLLEEGAACLLFHPRDPAAPAVRARLEAGRRLGIAQAYKCRTRRQWWRVPLAPLPNLFLTYMDQERPRLIANLARVQVLNSLYGVVLRPGLRRLGRAWLPIGFLNSVTLLGAEILGRSYGGGLLKLEPREADALPVPSPGRLAAVARALAAVRPAVAAALEAGALAPAVAAVDAVLLDGLAAPERAALSGARDLLFQRRRARGRRHAGD